jgi:hypothetical protein
MPNSNHDKICPILAAFIAKDAVSTGAAWASRCKGDECGWWDTERNRCAVAVIAEVFGRINPADIVSV